MLDLSAISALTSKSSAGVFSEVVFSVKPAIVFQQCSVVLCTGEKKKLSRGNVGMTEVGYEWGLSLMWT